MASHEELIAEMDKLEKLSHTARLKLAKKRRMKQLKKFQEWVRVDRQTVGSITQKRGTPVISFENGSLLNDLVSRNDLIGVSKLLDGGVDPNICNADGLTPLHKCCIDNELDMADTLMHHGVDINARDIEGWTPLHAAAATGNIQMINLLISEGASLVAINNDDRMPIDVAADSDIKYVLKTKMIEAGYTDDVLEYIRVSVAKTMLADLKDSIRNSRTLDLRDKYGTSALHIASSNGYKEVMEFLFVHGVNLDIADNEGWTPFHAAVCWRQTDMMKLLAKEGANLDLKNLRGETPYAIAEDPEVRQLILELKGQSGNKDGDDSVEQSGMVENEEELMPKGRRMSVKRISQQAKDEMSKQTVQDESSFREQSMQQLDIEMGLAGTIDKMADIVADEDDETITLLHMKSLSVAQEESKEKDGPDSSKHPTEGNKSTEKNGPDSSKHSTEGNKSTELTPTEGRVRPSRISLQDEPFHKSRVPGKSVLKHTKQNKSTTSSTFDSTASSSPETPSSDPVNSTIQQEKKCCVLM